MPGAASPSNGIPTALAPRIAQRRHKPRRRQRPRRGFTLLELIVALGIAGMLLTMGVPAWGKWIAERELRDRAEALQDTLDRARSEAIKRAARVDVCPLAGAACAGAAAPWENGWMMFVDANRSGDRDAGEPLIARERAAAEGITIRGNRPVADYVSYASTGQLRRIDGALQMGTFTVCRPGRNARKVVLANSGRVRIVDTSEICP